MLKVIVKKTAPLWLVSTLMVLAACSSTITPKYVSPSQYQGLDCARLSEEVARVESIINTTRKQSNVFSTSGVGIGVSAGRGGIYPSISFGIGKGQNNSARDDKLSQLYGERDALVQSARFKQCGFASRLKLYGEK